MSTQNLLISGGNFIFPREVTTSVGYLAQQKEKRKNGPHRKQPEKKGRRKFLVKKREGEEDRNRRRKGRHSTREKPQHSAQKLRKKREDRKQSFVVNPSSVNLCGLENFPAS